MKRFTWWRMEQNAPHNARERWCASCSILHHVKRFISQPPKRPRLDNCAYFFLLLIFFFETYSIRSHPIRWINPDK